MSKSFKVYGINSSFDALLKGLKYAYQSRYFLSLSLAVIHIITFIIFFFITPTTGLFLLLDGNAILNNKEIWRLITSMFIHLSLQTFFSVVLGILTLGIIIERSLTKKQYLFLYFTIGILTNILLMSIAPEVMFDSMGMIFTWGLAGVVATTSETDKLLNLKNLFSVISTIGITVLAIFQFNKIIGLIIQVDVDYNVTSLILKIVGTTVFSLVLGLFLGFVMRQNIMWGNIFFFIPGYVPRYKKLKELFRRYPEEFGNKWHYRRVKKKLVREIERKLKRIERRKEFRHMLDFDFFLKLNDEEIKGKLRRRITFLTYRYHTRGESYGEMHDYWQNKIGNSQTWNIIGRYAWRINHPQSAKKGLRAALRYDQNNSNAQSDLFFVLFLADNSGKKVDEEFHSFLAANTENKQEVLKQTLDKAEKIYDKNIRVIQNWSGYNSLDDQKAYYLLQKEKINTNVLEALSNISSIPSFCQTAIANAESWLKLGKLQIKLNKYFEARCHIRSSLHHNKDLVESRVQLLICLLSLNGVNELIDTEFPLILQIDSENALAWYYYGQALNSKYKFKEANEAFLKAVELDKNCFYAWKELAKAKKDQKQKIEYYKKTLTVFDNYWEAWKELYWIYIKENNFDEAENARVKNNLYCPDSERIKKYKIKNKKQKTKKKQNGKITTVRV